MGEPAAKKRRVWLRDQSSDAPLFSVWVGPDAIGDDLRRAATAELHGRERAGVTLWKANLTKLDPQELVPADIGVDGVSAIVVGVPAELAAAAPAEQFDPATEEGQKRLVGALTEKWGLREDRFEEPMPLTTNKFSFGQTQEREAAFVDLLTTWTANCMAGTTGREKLPLPAVPAAPGTGKTRFAWLAATRGRLPGSAAVDEEWRKAMDKLKAGDFKTGIQNAVGLAVTLGCDADPVSGEEHEYMIGVRMLYGHFCDVKVVTFVTFLELLRSHGSQLITPTEALQIIERDIEANHDALDSGAKRHVILVVDEPLRAVSKKEELRALITSVGQLITNCPHVHVLMTSLSGSDLREAARTVSGRMVHFIEGFDMLSRAAVQVLVASESDPDKQARLGRPRFQVVLSECLGVPRLLEKVFMTAGSPRINDDSSCEAIRMEVGRVFESRGKYRVRQFRSDALLAALSGPWRPASNERWQKTCAAEREGYLFDGKIPPLLLLWWSSMPDEPGMSDEMHALLQAAVGIYTLSDKVGGAEHGPRFEKQLAHLWRILTITDAVSRREAGEGQRRTIHGMLGSGQLAGADGAVSAKSLGNVAAVFNKSLGEMGAGRLLLPIKELDKPATGFTDVPGDFVYGTLYFPKDQQNPGFDFAVVEPAAAGDGGVLVLVEAKFSAEDASTELSQAEIVQQFVLAVKGRPRLRKHLLAGQLCYVIGGLRQVPANVMADLDSVVSTIVAELRKQRIAQHKQLCRLVRDSLVVLTRNHVEALLTPTLASLPPFSEPWG